VNIVENKEDATDYKNNDANKEDNTNTAKSMTDLWQQYSPMELEADKIIDYNKENFEI
jgi:hypothetical protein